MVKKTKSGQVREYLLGLTGAERAEPGKAKQYCIKKWKVGDPAFYTALKAVRLQLGEPLGPMSNKSTKKILVQRGKKFIGLKEKTQNSLISEFKAVKNLARDFGSLSRVKEVVELMEMAQTQ